MHSTYFNDQIKRIDGRFRVLEERVRKLENESLTERTQRVRLEDSLSGTEEYADVLEKQNKILFDALKILADVKNWTIHSGKIKFNHLGEIQPWLIAAEAIAEAAKLKE